MELEERVEKRRGGRDGGKLSRVAVRGRKAWVRGCEECLLRGRNKTMPFLERCRPTPTPTSSLYVTATGAATVLSVPKLPSQGREKSGVAARDSLSICIRTRIYVFRSVYMYMRVYIGMYALKRFFGHVPVEDLPDNAKTTISLDVEDGVV